MQNPLLVFDLDGTLSDPIDGIANSINHALAEHGFEQVSRACLSRYIGPPMDIIFGELTRSSETSVISACIATYRDRYARFGYAENKKYDGIDQVLDQLAHSGCRMGICTSKRQDWQKWCFSEKVLGTCRNESFPTDNMLSGELNCRYGGIPQAI